MKSYTLDELNSLQNNLQVAITNLIITIDTGIYTEERQLNIAKLKLKIYRKLAAKLAHSIYIRESKL